MFISSITFPPHVSNTFFLISSCYFQAIFESIEPETLTNQVMKYHKVVLQLEKGLPPNAVVPQLRGKVDKMRQKVRFLNYKLTSFRALVVCSL